MMYVSSSPDPYPSDREGAATVNEPEIAWRARGWCTCQYCCCGKQHRATHLLFSALSRLSRYFFYKAVFFSLSLYLLPRHLRLSFLFLCIPLFLGSLVGLDEFLLELGLSIENRLRNSKMVTLCCKGFGEGFLRCGPGFEWSNAIVDALGVIKNQRLCPCEVVANGHEVSRSS